MNKNRTIRIMIIAMLVVISFFSGDTFGKYISSIKKATIMQVATWNVNNDFLVNGISSTSEKIILSKSYDNTTLVDGKIAPGTSGKFTIKIDATGTDTGVEYGINFSDISSDLPENLLFIHNGVTYSNLQTLSNELSSGTIPANSANKVKIMDIIWSWPYETLDSLKNSTVGDTKDTTAGTTISSVSFNINIICKQVSPTTA